MGFLIKRCSILFEFEMYGGFLFISGLETIHWLFRLSIRFIKGAPAATISVVLMTLLSQVLSMLAFLLPLKVVMLLSSTQIPGFFPDVFSAFDRDVLILSLGGVALGCYTINIFVNKGIKWASVLGTEILQIKANKITLFKNQNKIAAEAYTNYAQALAGFSFSAIAISALLYLYFDVAILLLLYICLSVVLLVIAVNLRPEFVNRLSEKPALFLEFVSNTCFFSVFIFVVYDFLYLSPPEFFVAMFAMIMTRRLLSLLAGAVSRTLKLRDKKEKIDALFFHNKIFISPDKDKGKSLWNLLEPENLEKCLSKLMDDVLGLKAVGMSTQWLQLRTKNIIALKVLLVRQEKVFLVKFFNENIVESAQHELSLLLEYSEQLPSPKLLHVTTEFGFQCHLFDITDCERISYLESENFRFDFFQQLLMWKPPVELVRQYKRSKLFLWQRIDSSLFERVRLVADDGQRSVINNVEQELPALLPILKSLPMVIHTPLNKGPALTFSRGNGEVVSANWEGWSLEPIGFNWAVDFNSLEKLESYLSGFCGIRADCKKAPLKYVVLVSLFSEFETNVEYHALYDAIKLLEIIMAVIRLDVEGFSFSSPEVKELFLH